MPESRSIPAATVGAPHRRDRVWIVAYSYSERRQKQCGAEPMGTQLTSAQCSSAYVADTPSPRCKKGLRTAGGTQNFGRESQPERRSPGVPDTDCEPQVWPAITWGKHRHWSAEPEVDRVAHGVPRRVDRIRGLGNAIVPQVAEPIIRRIIELDTERIAS